MDKRQCRMARAALEWSRDDLAQKAQIAPMTVARFETGGIVSDVSRTKMRLAFEKARVKFIDDGPFKGAMVRISAGSSIRLRPPADED